MHSAGFGVQPPGRASDWGIEIALYSLSGMLHTMQNRNQDKHNTHEIRLLKSAFCNQYETCGIPRDDMSEEEAVALVAKAIRAGIFNDLGSGSNVDVCIIRKDGVDYRRNTEFLQVHGPAVLSCSALSSRQAV